MKIHINYIKNKTFDHSYLSGEIFMYCIVKVYKKCMYMHLINIQYFDKKKTKRRLNSV